MPQKTPIKRLILAALAVSMAAPAMAATNMHTGDGGSPWAGKATVLREEYDGVGVDEKSYRGAKWTNAKGVQGNEVEFLIEPRQQKVQSNSTETPDFSASEIEVSSIEIPGEIFTQENIDPEAVKGVDTRFFGTGEYDVDPDFVNRLEFTGLMMPSLVTEERVDFGRIDQHDDFMNYFTFALESDKRRNTKHDTIKMKGSRYDSLMGDPVVQQKDLKISEGVELFRYGIY